MGQAIKEVKKMGAKNKVINASVKETMALILKNRELRLQKELEERKEAIRLKKLQTN